MSELVRCAWASNDQEVRYHDSEWGVPSFDDRHLFEMLVLEGAQAGLSWDTILRKRAAYRSAFEGFDPERVAFFDEPRQAELMLDAGIVRNRAKIASAVSNARAFLKVRDEFDGFHRFVWRYVDGKPVRNSWKSLSELPASTPVSDAMSKDLKKRGFNFVGSTICYAFMQSIGMVNDHVVGCFRYPECSELA